MVLGNNEPDKQNEKNDNFQSKQSNDNGGGVSGWALTKVVKLVLKNCISNGPEWKTFFEKMAQKAYTEEKDSLLQMTK